MKAKFITVFGVTNKHSRKDYSFFADYDDVPLATVKLRAERVLEASGAPYACLVTSNPGRYHLYVPGFFTGEEVMRLFWFAKCDPWFQAFFMKHGRNVLRWTRKEKNEPAMTCVWETRNPESKRKAPLELCALLDELFGCKTKDVPCVSKGSLEFSEYHMRPNGFKFYNKFLTSKGLNKRVKEVLQLGEA
jgi:hypothetical protein